MSSAYSATKHGIAGLTKAYEYGSSYPMLETLKRAFDPQTIMNMGTIIPR